jgi:hypothetical protein
MIRTRSTLLVPFLSIFLAATSAAFAHELARDARERAVDHRELRQDAAQTAGDLRDVEYLRGLSARYRAARAAGDVGSILRLEAEIRHAVRAELAEGAAELAQDQAELRRDRREVRSDRREVSRDVAEGRPGREADDRHDLRDDRRDRRDDRRDATVERLSQEQRRDVLNELVRLQGDVAPPALARKAELLQTLTRAAEAELRQNRRESREDRRELREDRRETREDWRQR